MSKNLFNSIAIRKPQHNAFDMTHDFKFSGNMGTLIPIMCEEAIPGDYHMLAGSCMVRFAPMLAPIMHRVDVTLHYFFVPYRILWPGWEDFITNGGLAETPPAFPTMYYNSGTGTWYSGGLLDFLGLPQPIVGGGSETVSALPFAAYQKIYNDYYRDQNLIPEVPYELIDGSNMANVANLFQLRNRAWEHDYFTSCLPFAQKGAAVDLPLGTVELASNWQTIANGNPHFNSFATGGDIVNGGLAATLHTPASIGGNLGAAITDVAGDPDNDVYAYDPAGTLQVAATTINDLRRAEMLQQWLELNARAGTRYTEFLQAHFNVRPEDARLQRPEYITGVKTPVVISEVLNTTGTVDAPQGNMAGHGISVTSGNFGKYAVKEHGLIMGIMSVLPKTAYQQGIQRHWLKTTDAFEYYFKQFENIGEQEVLNREVYAFQDVAGDNTFGYVPRYAEYRFANNRVAGDFRSTQNFWHMGRIFSAAPSLNAQFVTSDPTTRIFAVTDPSVAHLYCQVLNKWTAVRPMGKFGTPHF